MIITLKNGCLTAGIDTMGAQLISLKDKDGTEYIWQRDPEVWKKANFSLRLSTSQKVPSPIGFIMAVER